MNLLKKAAFPQDVLNLYRSYNREHYNLSLENYITNFTGEGDLPACLRIFNSLMLINGLVFFSAFIGSLFSPLSLQNSLLVLLWSGLSYFAYYLCFTRCQFNQAIIVAILVMYGVLTHTFYICGGISSVFLICLLVYHLNFLFILRPSRHLGFTILNIILVLGAYCFEQYYPNALLDAVSPVYLKLGAVIGCFYAIIELYISLYIMKRESDILRRDAESQTESLREVARVQNQMISIISHDVRAPLANIEQMLQMINHGMIPPEKRKEFDVQLLNATRQTREILESMVTWTRAQVSDLKLGVVPELSCDLDVVLRNELEDWEAAAKQKNMNISYHAYCSLPALVKADQNLVKTVLRNLVFNAIKFTPQKGQVTIGVAETPNSIQIVVKDTGVGMSEEQANSLFKGRLTSRKGTDGEKGSGLGLWIIGDMLARVQGTVKVQSELGKGSAFTAEIPKA